MVPRIYAYARTVGAAHAPTAATYVMRFLSTVTHGCSSTRSLDSINVDWEDLTQEQLCAIHMSFWQSSVTHHQLSLARLATLSQCWVAFRYNTTHTAHLALKSIERIRIEGGLWTEPLCVVESAGRLYWCALCEYTAVDPVDWVHNIVGLRKNN